MNREASRNLEDLSRHNPSRINKLQCTIATNRLDIRDRDPRIVMVELFRSTLDGRSTIL
jgi:hypothetical protein